MIASQAPVIETERLIMRPHRLDDFESVAAMWAEPEVVRHISGRPSTPELSWARLLRYAGHWALLGYGYWAVQERDTGAFVGEVGYADYHREIEPSLDGIPELGWFVASSAHGKGVTTEATRAAVAWGEAHFTVPRIACIIAPENLASIRVAEKCGFRLLQETQYQGQPTLMYMRELSPRNV